MSPLDYCFNHPADGGSTDGDYYLIFGKLRNDEAVEMFIAFTTKGDDEFDRIVKQLGLKSFSTTENHYETAEEWAKKDARKIHPTLPVEIRFMDDGEISPPSGMFRLPVDDQNPQTCQNCQSDGEELECWLSFAQWGHPFFCSWQCANKWYVELPLATFQASRSNDLAACGQGGIV